MQKQHHVYLSTGQIKAIASLGLLDGEKGISITQVDLFEGGEHAGDILVGVTGQFPSAAHIDKDGNIVFNQLENA